MKRNLKLFILSILIISISIILINYKKIDNNILENKEEEKKVIYNGLAIMIEKDNGKYEAAQGDEWKTGYEFNSTLSKCENGGILTYNPDTHKITLKATGSDRCYVYFNKIKPYHETCTANTLACEIAKKQGQAISGFTKDGGYNGKDYSGELIYHDENSQDETVKNYGAADGGYRYSGDNPNNFVCFGPGAESYSRNGGTCEAKNLYRIIGIVPVETESGTQNLIKLIQSEYATQDQLGINSDGTPDTGSYTNLKRVKELPSNGFYWNTTQSSTYYNIWADDANGENSKKATLNHALNNETSGYLKYLNNSQKVDQQGIDWTSKIETVKWNIAGGNDSELYSVTPKIAYNTEKNNSTAGSNKATQTTSTAKIGLMYVHDYGFASDKSNWKTNLGGYNTDTNRQKNWLFNGVYEWTISRYSDFYISAFSVYSDGHVYDYRVPNNAFGVRPVFYLKSDTLFSGGDGTAKTPYKINLQ